MQCTVTTLKDNNKKVQTNSQVKKYKLQCDLLQDSRCLGQVSETASTLQEHTVK